MTPEVQRKYAHLVLETTPGPHNHMMTELAALKRRPVASTFNWLGFDWAAHKAACEAAYIEMVKTGTAMLITKIDIMPAPEPAIDQDGTVCWPVRIVWVNGQPLPDMLGNGHP